MCCSLGSHPMVGTFPTLWGLQHNSGFTFTALFNGLSGCPSSASPGTCLASRAFLNCEGRIPQPPFSFILYDSKARTTTLPCLETKGSGQSSLDWFGVCVKQTLSSKWTSWGGNPLLTIWCIGATKTLIRMLGIWTQASCLHSKWSYLVSHLPSPTRHSSD